MVHYLDLQVNGYRGVDFSSEALTRSALDQACHWLLDAKTAAFLPTVITSPETIYRRNLKLIGDAIRETASESNPCGIHVEGPFISAEPGAVGAHNPAWVRTPDTGLLDSMIEWSGNTIRLLTLAPDIPGAERMIAHAVKQGIVVSLGHTLAGVEQMSAGADAGARALTHLGNGMPNTAPRHHNPLWAGLAEDRLIAMIITDGHHLPPHVIKTILRAKTPARCIVVSDASPLAGLPPGRYETLGNTAVLEPDGRLHNPEKGCLVGSSATISQCIEYLSGLGFLTAEELEAVGRGNAEELLRG